MVRSSEAAHMEEEEKPVEVAVARVIFGLGC